MNVDIILLIANSSRDVRVIPQSLIEDRLVQRTFSSTQPHAPFLDGSKVEEVGVEFVSGDGHEESTDGVEEIVIGGGLN
jgi:hypothetical protein